MYKNIVQVSINVTCGQHGWIHWPSDYINEAVMYADPQNAFNPLGIDIFDNRKQIFRQIPPK